MTYGIQVLDNAGAVKLDISDRTLRLKSIIDVTTPDGNTTSTVTVTGVTPATSEVVLDNGAIARVTANNTVTLYGSVGSQNTKLRWLEY